MPGARSGGRVLWAVLRAAGRSVGLWIGFQPEGTRLAFDGSFVSDGFARFAKVLILFGAAATLALSHEYLDRAELMKFEYPVLIVLSAVGMMTMVSARDLIVLYMGLELQSLALYVVAAFRRDTLRSTEAGLKYFVLGALSSGLLLYGASLTYGFAGTTALRRHRRGDRRRAAAARPGLRAGVPLPPASPSRSRPRRSTCGRPTSTRARRPRSPPSSPPRPRSRRRRCSRACSSTPSAARSRTGSRSSRFLSVASMFLGAVAAIGQRNFKRLMAYSSISHMGFALMGLAAGTVEGAQSLLIYLAIYVTMNVGIFAFILNMERDGKPVIDITRSGSTPGSSRRARAALAVLLFSLAGVPPLVGFFGKFYVLKAAVDAGLVWLAVAGVVASVIGAFYYLRIVYLMYFGEAVRAARRPDAGAALGAARRLGARHGARRRQPLRRRGDRRRRRRHARAVAHDGLARRRRPRDPSPSSTAPTPRRCAAPPPARPGRSGSSRARRPPRAAAAAGPGRRRRATSPRRLLMRPPGAPAAAALRSFVAALGLFDALVAATGRPELFALKWPNDVLLGGRQARRHPARDRRPPAARRARDRHRRQPRRRPGPGDARAGRGAAGRPRAPPPASRSAPEDFLDLLAPAVQALGGPARRRGLRAAARRLARPRRPARRGDHARGCPTARSPAASRRSTPPARWCSRPPSGRVALPAAEVHFGAVEAPHAARH